MVSPPFGQEGGPEVVCRHLTNALLEKGFDVTLFAPADWKTRARHIPTLNQSLWKMKNFKKQSEVYRKNLIFCSQLEVLKHEEKFDIIHLHAQRNAYTVAKFSKKPCILTLHNSIGSMEFEQIKEVGIHPVAISSGRKGKLKMSAVIENGINVEELEYSFHKGKYMITVGRLLEQKGIDLAIKIARKAGKKLFIIGRKGNSPERQKYFKDKIKPFLNSRIILKEQMPQPDLYKYVKNAEAILSPIRGKLSVVPLIIMEALACGTPVIGTPVSSIPAILKNKNIGCFSNNLKDLTIAAKNTDKFDRRECRKYAEKYFNSSIMADKYIRLYKKVAFSEK